MNQSTPFVPSFAVTLTLQDVRLAAGLPLIKQSCTIPWQKTKQQQPTWKE